MLKLIIVKKKTRLERVNSISFILYRLIKFSDAIS